MFEHFGFAARDAIKRAKDEATQLNHGSIDTPHLLLAIIGESTHIAKSAHTSYHTVRSSIETVIGVGDRPCYGFLPFTEELNETVRHSINLTLQHRHFPLTPLHMCVSMLQNEQDVIHRVLQEARVDITLFRSRLEHQLITVPKVWSPFHTNLPPFVSMFIKNYTRDEILLLQHQWQPLDTI